MPSSYRRTTLDGHQLHPTTQMVSFGYDPALSEGAVKPPVFLTSTFVFRSAEEGADFFDVVAGRKPAPEGMGAGGLVYSRFNHPNTEIVEDRLALFDGAEAAIVTASGMAAIGAVMLTYLRPGDALVHYTPLYGGTETLIGKVLLKAWSRYRKPVLVAETVTGTTTAGIGLQQGRLVPTHRRRSRRSRSRRR